MNRLEKLQQQKEKLAVDVDFFINSHYDEGKRKHDNYSLRLALIEQTILLEEIKQLLRDVLK